MIEAAFAAAGWFVAGFMLRSLLATDAQEVRAHVAETSDEDPRGTEVPPTPNNPDREGVYYNPEDER